MEIYTLTGSSGTGKSYRAMDICKEHNIDAVIDDGLFIYKGTIIAGESAKKSGTKIGAIKEAIFNDEQKAKKVARAIRHKNPRSILILGTSDAMADLIIERLELNMSKKGSPQGIEAGEKDIYRRHHHGSRAYGGQKAKKEHGKTRNSCSGHAAQKIFCRILSGYPGTL